MTKKEFINQYSIADTMPIDPSRIAIPAEAFSSAVTEFMEKKFSGAIKVNCGAISAQSILVCTEYAAYFLKMLLADVYGRVMLNLDIFSDESGLHLDIGADEELPISDKEMRELIRFARNAGFDIRPYSCSIRLSAGFAPAAIRHVYAVALVDGKHIMIGKLVEIFCHGELLSTDPPPPRSMPEPIKKRATRKKTTKKTDGNE